MSSPRTLQARARLQASRQALQRHLHRPEAPNGPGLGALTCSHPWLLVGAGLAGGALLGAVLLRRRPVLTRPTLAPLLAQFALGLAWRALGRLRQREASP